MTKRTLFRYPPSLNGETPEGVMIVSSGVFCEYLHRMKLLKNLIQISRVSDSENKFHVLIECWHLKQQQFRKVIFPHLNLPFIYEK